MNNVLRHVVCRRRLTGKDFHPWHPVGRWVGFDAIVVRDDVQHVHELSLVLMDTLDLHIKQRFRVGHHVQVQRKIHRQPLLVQKLGFTHGFVHRREIQVLFKLAQLTQIGTPGAANMFVQDVGERLVSQRQPATRGNTVRHVAKTRREDLREISKQRLHHQVRVQSGNPVHLVTDHHRQPGHTHAATVGFIND